MNDPRDGNQPSDDQEFGADSEELQDLDEIEVEVDEAEQVKGGRMEDPCAGGQIHRN